MRNRVKSIFLLIMCLLLVSTGCNNYSNKPAAVTDPDTGEIIETSDGYEQTSADGEAESSDGSNDETVSDKEQGGETESSAEQGTASEGGNDGNAGGTMNPGFDSSKTVFNIDEDVLPYTQEEIYAQLFDINNKVEINVDISDSELAKLQKDYDEYSNKGSKSPIYRKASVDIKITTSKDSYTYHIDEVGIRMKGNTSRTSFYSKSEGKYNLIHFKLDFQETFDDEEYYTTDAKDWGSDEAARDARKDRTFATLEKIDVKWNRNDDATYLREYYAYETYRANGVLAPHTNIASVDMVGTHEGVFIFYEPIDKIFIEKYVAEADQGGDLYKCGWTNIGASFSSGCSIGIEDEDNGKFYNYDLKTNKKSSQNTQLKNLISVLNGGELDKDTIADVVDIDYFLKYEAVSYFVGNPDDMRNNFNNYYIYFLKSSGKVIFIPYDMDRCFGVTKGYNPNGDGMTSVSPFSKYAAGANTRQSNPLYIYTVDEGGYYVSEFAEVLKKVADSEWLTSAKFKSLYGIAYNNYKNDTTPDKSFHNAGGYNFTFSNSSMGSLNSDNSNASFDEYISAKMYSYKNYIAKAEQYSSTTTVQPYYIRGSFTGWNVEDKYMMTYDSKAEVYTYTLTLTGKESFKVNNGVDGEPGIWYGYEDVVYYSGVGTMENDDYDNIILPKGTYTITFSSKEKTVKIQ